MKRLFKLALIVGGIAAASKLVAAKKSEWQGLTEPQVREKLDAQLPDRMPEEKRAAVADKIVSTMRDRGALADEGSESAAASEDVTPEDVTPEDVTAMDVTPEDVTPEDVTAMDVTPEDVTSEDDTSEDDTDSA